MSIDRIERVNEMIRREVSVILQNDINDPTIKNVTVTRVEVTRDLSIAKVFYTALNEEPRKSKAEIARALKKAGSFIRGRLAESVSMKSIPRVSFLEDTEEKEDQSLRDIFKKIEEERRQNEPGQHE